MKIKADFRAFSASSNLIEQKKKFNEWRSISCASVPFATGDNSEMDRWKGMDVSAEENNG